MYSLPKALEVMTKHMLIVVQAIHLPSAARVTVLIKLDKEPGDYAIRISSTSQLQNLQGYSILRYPVSAQVRVDQSTYCAFLVTYVASKGKAPTQHSW